MRVALVHDELSEKMGYAENCLPRALVNAGCQVEMFSSNVQVYWRDPDYSRVYEPFLGPRFVEPSTREVDGYVLHRDQYKYFWRRVRYIEGLVQNLRKFRPDVVQTFDCISLSSMQCAYQAERLGFRLFTAIHTHASVYEPARHYSQFGVISKLRLFLADTLPGSLVGRRLERCYAIAPDAAEIGWKFYGVPKEKIVVSPLGVDTSQFHPPRSERDRQTRNALRQSWGIEPEDILCVYTGRFTSSKSPLLLAQAIARIGGNYRGLFVGSGPQESAIRQTLPTAVVIPFVDFKNLGDVYRSADIGVWPKQESTSMLDAAASGLPIIISNHTKTTERIEGNGLAYREPDPQSLADALLKLQSTDVRRSFGAAGAAKVEAHFSWNKIAAARVDDYSNSIS